MTNLTPTALRMQRILDAHGLEGIAREFERLQSPNTFQYRVAAWIQHCFGPEIGADQTERNHRFIEEALELAQAGGCTASEAHQLVDYVFDRPVGEMKQEVGGVMNTLAALCSAHRIDLTTAAETELLRVWEKSDQIRAKQAAKPKHSPLPAAPLETPPLRQVEQKDARIAELEALLRTWADDRAVMMGRPENGLI